MIYVKDLIEVCNGKLLCGDINLPLNNFSKDTRLINKDDVYIGIKGESFDGNKFLPFISNAAVPACITGRFNN